MCTLSARWVHKMKNYKTKKLKTLVIYFSQSGNTQKIAEAIHIGIKKTNNLCDLVRMEDVAMRELKNYDMIGIGSPTHCVQAPPNVKDFISSLTGNVDGKFCFVFYTHGALPAFFLASTVPALKQSGMEVIGWKDWFGDVYGYAVVPKPYFTGRHPDAIDLKEAAEFGKEMIERAFRILHGETNLVPELPTGKAYRDYWMPLLPPEGQDEWHKVANRLYFEIDKNKCKYPYCSICVDNCPRNAIDFTIDPPHFDHECMLCFRCTLNCPQNAINVDFEGKIREALPKDGKSTMAFSISTSDESVGVKPRKAIKTPQEAHDELAKKWLAQSLLLFEKTGYFRSYIKEEEAGWETPCYKWHISPCRSFCPSMVDVAGCNALIAEGRFEDAYQLIKRDAPFPSICGYLCPPDCENVCNRGKIQEPYNEAISIRGLKRFVADYALNGNMPSVEKMPKNGKSVAIVGSGPSGLSCAYYLARLGYDIDIYEAEKVAGGIPAWAAPEFKLPKELLAKEVKAIEDLGVKIHLNTKVGRDVALAELRKNHDAIYIATGAKKPRMLRVKGGELEGIVGAIEFLKKIALEGKCKVKGKVAVIGGGGVGMDAARAALRCGAKGVRLFCVEPENEMLATKDDIRLAKEEGIEITNSVGPVKFSGKGGHVSKVYLAQMEIWYDELGRFAPRAVEKTEFSVEADMVILAIGQETEIDFIGNENISITELGAIKTDPVTMQTGEEDIFAGGDVARTPSTAIQAIADGKKAASKIDKYLGGSGVLNKGAQIDIPEKVYNNDIEEYGRVAITELAPKERNKTFQKVFCGYCAEDAVKEAKRCMRCDNSYVSSEKLLDVY
jgi:NADPH-dependent glutamate synthase beta subunit-like oxidoreductase/flavodoxin/Fe-S-cluster-containing hydrogenase component 2